MNKSCEYIPIYDFMSYVLCSTEYIKGRFAECSGDTMMHVGVVQGYLYECILDRALGYNKLGLHWRCHSLSTAYGQYT